MRSRPPRVFLRPCIFGDEPSAGHMAGSAVCTGAIGFTSQRSPSIGLNRGNAERTGLPGDTTTAFCDRHRRFRVFPIRLLRS
jgi:hypothetical protein